uniref:Uncharacterized protein n=1 Tax=Siphoviridae sp. ctWsj12 TaxID=2826363 RepID=A0A8S5NQY9_9CAUD|nr:MAG TPA: hypothetical protein [Siphoviridae sp. ctWsj12]
MKLFISKFASAVFLFRIYCCSYNIYLVYFKYIKTRGVEQICR